MSKKINISYLCEALLQFLLKTDNKSVKVKSNTFRILSDKALQINSTKTFLKEMKKSAENLALLMRESYLGMKSECKAVIIIDNDTYVFYREKNKVDISVFKYSKSDLKNIKLEYNQLVNDNIDLFKTNYVDIVSKVSRKDFLELKNSPFEDYRASIYSGDINKYVSPDFLELCDKFPEAFLKENLDTVIELKKNKYAKPVVSDYNKELKMMFNSWYKFLTTKNATKNNKLSFNDDDNFAYIDSNDNYEMMTQKSQNTVYVYVREKLTGHIRVWNSVLISELEDSDLEYYINEKETYFSLVKSLMNPYSYDVYYSNLDNIEGYLKSPEYYLNNFNSEEFIIYDNKLGYNRESNHSYNLMSDFALLYDVLQSNKKYL